MTPLETLAAIGGSSIVTLLVQKLLGKKKENADIEHQWRNTRELDVKFSEGFQKLVEEKVLERTLDLRNTIVENDIAHRKEIRAQGEIWSNKYVTLEEQSERRIKILEMKIEIMERRFKEQIELFEKALQQEREDCDSKLANLQRQINEK